MSAKAPRSVTAGAGLAAGKQRQQDMSKSLPAGRSETPIQRPNPCLLAARAPVSAKAPKSAPAGGSGVSKQKQRSFQIMLGAGLAAGKQRQQHMSKSLPAGRSASPVQRPNPCLLVGPGASERKGAQICDCWCRPGGRQAKAAGHVQITACWPVRVASAKAEPVPAGNPGSSERKGAQICDCWWLRRQQAKAMIFPNYACGPAWRPASKGSRTCPNHCLLAGPRRQCRGRTCAC